jgi:hypothetical protein
LNGKANNEEASAGGTAPGIAIFIFGSREYAYAAQHLALTLREYSPGIPIHLWAAENMKVDATMFDHVHPLEVKWYMNGPGELKLNIHDILPAGDWLYLDADTINIADLRPYIGKLKAHDFAIEVKGKGGEKDIIAYTPWATQATIKEINGIPDGATYYGVQSSWMWIRKGATQPADIFYRAQSCCYKPSDLKEKWGTSIPDELCIATALTALGIDPHTESLSFYGGESKTFNEVKAQYPLACLYGDRKKHRLVRDNWFDQYDRFIRALYRKHNRLMGMDIFRIMNGKYIAQ